MSFARIQTFASAGLEAPSVSVEVHLANGLPSFSIVGLPEGAVRESRERVRSALQSCGFSLPDKRITVNLAPADLPKSGSRYDLPIALGVLVASGQLPASPVTQRAWLGELGLSGAVRGVEGLFPAALSALQHQCALGVPQDNLVELSVLSSLDVLGVQHLSELAAWAQGEGSLAKLCGETVAQQVVSVLDWSEVKGQLQAKRALEVAVAGGHAVLMLGPPGCGKSMLAERLPTLMPSLQLDAAQTVAAIWSVAGKRREGGMFFQPPYQKAESTISVAGLLGGGQPVRPGVMSLAHHGVLFLDELAEFRRDVLESLRAPFESGEVHLARARQQVTFPARPHVLVAASNPSPSGYFPQDSRCKDTPDQIRRYLSKLSGPLLDRMDIYLTLQPVPPETLTTIPNGEHSETVRDRIAQVWQRQLERQGCFNAALHGIQLEKEVVLDQSSKKFLQQAMQQLGLSARSYTRILRVARTLADLAQAERVELLHVQEAIGLRRLPEGLQ